jgi:ADP-heptose:LPS heptosyltransferase
MIAGDTGPLHLAAAVGTATVGLFWAGNFINGAAMDRARHRPLLSWTLNCPQCGRDCTRGGGCAHRPSFIVDIPLAEVVAAALDLLDSAGRPRAE